MLRQYGEKSVGMDKKGKVVLPVERHSCQRNGRRRKR